MNVSNVGTGNRGGDSSLKHMTTVIWLEFKEKLKMMYYNTDEPFFLSSYSLFQDINKRLSLPADIRLPEGYLEKFAMNSPPFDKPMSRRLRRASLVSAPCVRLCVCIFAFVYMRAKQLKLVAVGRFGVVVFSVPVYFWEHCWLCAVLLTRLCWETKVIWTLSAIVHLLTWSSKAFICTDTHIQT